VYLPASDDTEVVDLIVRLSAGSIDAIAFTTRTQVDRLFEVAASRELTEELQRGLARTLVAAVGPLVVASLQERGVLAEAAPERSFFLRPLVEQLVEVVSHRPRQRSTS
jgi:uroporphyrinogen-III synthase